MSEHMCHRCEVWMTIEDGMEPSEFCHGCAQDVVVELQARIAQLLALLERVPHHGPNGSYSKAEGQCWPDCVACEAEKMKQHVPEKLHQ